MPVLPAPRGVAGGQCQEMWQEEERSNNKGCRSQPICSVLMSEPRSSWTRRDPQCVTVMRTCARVHVCVCPFPANWTQFLTECEAKTRPEKVEHQQLESYSLCSISTTSPHWTALGSVSLLHASAMMEWWEHGARIDRPLSSSGPHTRACIPLQKLVL